MKLIRRQGLTVTYNQARTIPFNCEIESFISALKAFSGFYEYPFDGERFVYDEYDTLLDGSNGYQDAYKYVWRIKFYKLRSTYHINEEMEFSFDVIGQELFEVERIQEHSPLISGTFMMEIGQ